MKAKLTFDLSEPDDRMAHAQCVKAEDMWIALSEIAYWSKHSVPDSGTAMLQEIRERIYQRIPDLDELGQ